MQVGVAGCDAAAGGLRSAAYAIASTKPAGWTYVGLASPPRLDSGELVSPYFNPRVLDKPAATLNQLRFNSHCTAHRLAS